MSTFKMAAPLENVSETRESVDLDDLCEVEATVASGLEEVAKDEAEEKLGVSVTAQRGRIIFKIPIKNVKQVKV